MLLKTILMGGLTVMPSSILGSDMAIDWHPYHAAEGMEYYWAPNVQDFAQIGERPVRTVLASAFPAPEERGGEHEPASFEWRFAIDCAANEIAIIEYAAGKYGKMDQAKRYVMETPQFKGIGNPPGGSYEVELARLVCEADAT
jgi:hypothetical protein